MGGFQQTERGNTYQHDIDAHPGGLLYVSDVEASHFLDHYAQRRPGAVHRILTAAHIGVVTVPGMSVGAMVTGHTAVALIGVFASILFYATGYCAAAVRYLRRLHAAVAQARRDALTGLPTRAVADQILDSASREATGLTVALADIDGLHAINANLGHAAGDQYIKAVAHRLARAVPDGGCLVRQGGDEFILLVPDTHPEQLATAIGAALAGPTIIAGYRIQPRASVGIAASGGGDAHYARACADAAMYGAKFAGGNHTLIYRPDRDGQPAPDGTRPLLRRRDINPVSHDGVAWLPAPGDDLLPVMFSLDEARTVHQALCTARDWWAQAATNARGGHEAPDTPGLSAPDRMTIEPTPSGHRTLAEHVADQQAKHARLADRVAPIIQAGERLATTGHSPHQAAGVANTALTGITAQFTAIDVECLVITAAEAVYGELANLSTRQRDLAARAYTLLQADDDHA